MKITGLILIVAIVSIFLFFYLLHHKDEAMCLEHKPQNKRIVVNGYWLDTGKRFENQAIIGEYDGESNDDDIFYYFDSPEEVVGKHGSFYITSFQEV
jgi:hypothetical protein